MTGFSALVAILCLCVTVHTVWGDDAFARALHESASELKLDDTYVKQVLKQVEQADAARKADTDFVEYVMTELDRRIAGKEPQAPFTARPNPAIVWCTDRHLCKYGFFIQWQENAGLSVREYKLASAADLVAGCAAKLRHGRKLKLDFKCGDEEEEQATIEQI